MRRTIFGMAVGTCIGRVLGLGLRGDSAVDLVYGAFGIIAIIGCYYGYPPASQFD